MDSRQDERKRFYSTEEVLTYLCVDRKSDLTSSEGSTDDWQSDDNDSDDGYVVKRAKLTIPTLVKGSHQRQQQSSSNSEISQIRETSNTDDEARSETMSYSEEIDTESEESSNTSSGSEDDGDGDSEWVDSTIMSGSSSEGELEEIEDDEHSSVVGYGDGDVQHSMVDGDGDVEHSSVVGDGDVELSSVFSGGDVEHSTVDGNGDVENSTVDGSGDVEHTSVVGDGDVDVELSSVVGDGDVELSSVVGDGNVELVGDGDDNVELVGDGDDNVELVGDGDDNVELVGDGDDEHSMVDGDKGSREGHGSSHGSGSTGGHGGSRSSGGRGGRGSSRGSSRGSGSTGGRVSSRGSDSRGGRGSRPRGGRGRQAEFANTSQTNEEVPSTSIPISVEYSHHIEPDDFHPLRVPGPYLPEHVDEDPSELDLFQLFIDEHILERLVTSTNDYAEEIRHKKPNMYKRFERHRLTPDEMMRYIGCLLLLSINSVRNYCLAWSKKSSQHLSHLHRLLTRDHFEAIGAFLHVVTKEEEASLSSHKLKKILPLHDVIKKKCLELYQPLQQLSMDEHMVKSKTRTQFRQYIRNKPTKWGYKYWVLADPTVYTVDFDIYCGTDQQSSGKGLGYDVVAKLTLPFQFQGYQVFCDNFYSSSSLFGDLLDKGIAATGTVRTNRVGVPKEVQRIK